MPEVLRRLEVIPSEALVIYGAPELSADLFHAVPGIIDPFLYIESDGRRAATVSQLDADKVTALGIEILDPYELGADELLSRGISRHEVDIELARRACERLGVQRALVRRSSRSASPTTCAAPGSRWWSTPRRSSAGGGSRARARSRHPRAQRAADAAMGSPPG